MKWFLRVRISKKCTLCPGSRECVSKGGSEGVSVDVVHVVLSQLVLIISSAVV
jgi:hypothetical protein